MRYSLLLSIKPSNFKYTELVIILRVIPENLVSTNNYLIVKSIPSLLHALASIRSERIEETSIH